MRISDVILNLSTILKEQGDLEVVIPQRNISQFKDRKWISGISYIELGNNDWDEWGDTKYKVVIF